MKLSNNGTLLKSNFNGSSRQFGIGDMSIVIEILTKLYKNPIRTLTQEYLSNGRDANRESGTKEKMIVTLPTLLNPELRIRDFGPGLSKQRIEEVFLLYGESTKRTSNKMTGGFGIGAKSAWSYVDSFTVTSYINGTKMRVCKFKVVNVCKNERNEVLYNTPKEGKIVNSFKVGDLVQFTIETEVTYITEYLDTLFFNEGEIVEIMKLDDSGDGYFLVSNIYGQEAWVHENYFELVKE